MAPTLSSERTSLLRREIYVTGSPAGIIVGIILLLALIGGGVFLCIFLSRRNKARKPQLFVPPGQNAQNQYLQNQKGPGQPLASDQVPMLAPPQDPFTDTAAAPTPAYGQPHSGYAPNTGGYTAPAPAPSSGYTPGYSNNNSPYPASGPPGSTSTVVLGAYPGAPPQDSHLNTNQNSFTPPPGPPPPPVMTV
ncbi:hypothetical protein DFH06DRAFT_461444 [Mycena polygramma]|nr:hypothetical protein DFH06DRAFT_461444 [Mycena polygramma]